MEGLRVAIVGGSIGGLAAANALRRLGANVSVFERSAAPFSGRGGSIGFCHVPLWESVRGAQMLRRGAQASRAQGAFLYGDLWRFWYNGLAPGTVRFGAEVDSLGEDPWHPHVGGDAFHLAIVADGGWSALRPRYFDASPPAYAGYEVWRFRVERRHVPFAVEGEHYSSLGGPFFTIHLHVAADDGTDWVMGGVSVAKPESELARKPAAENKRNRQADDTPTELPPWFLPFYAKHFGGAAGGRVLRVMQAAAAVGKVTPQAQYEFASKRVVAGRLVLLGDAAHMASPRTAAGAHTAVLDAAALGDAFAQVAASQRPRSDDDDGLLKCVDEALAAYDAPALERAAGLYARSRQVSAPVAVQGWSYRDRDEL